MAEMSTPLFTPQPTDRWVRDLIRRSQRRMEALDDPALQDLLEDAHYQERKRLERCTAEKGERETLDRLARSLVREGRRERIDAGLSLVALWGREIHGRFNPRVYRLATRVLPRALGGMLAQRPHSLRELRHLDLDLGKRLTLGGDVALIRELVNEGTVVLAPTHVSNMDSPLLGLALHQAELPPFVYGAGLNLFSNPILGWWLRRLGAYTVDRRKRAALYKEVLKDYSILCMRGGLHSLFFPGGTRCRSHMLETKLKKGLLGTGIIAWQENLEARVPKPDIFVVPCTLTYQLVLEASTLIDDHLAEAGKERYIIEDDEFSNPQRVASFTRRLMEMDSAVVCHFGTPMDCMGNPISSDKKERAEQAKRRLTYVTDRDGKVEWNSQRDRRYTERLAGRVVDAYQRDTTVLANHLVCKVAWAELSDRRGTDDPFRLVRTTRAARHIPRKAVLQRLERAMEMVRRGAEEGRWNQLMPSTASAALDESMERMAGFHKTRALCTDGDDLVVEDPRLCLYYQNRLETLDLEV